VLPPAQLSGGVGPTWGDVHSSAAKLEPQTQTTFRAGLHPLQVRSEAAAAPVDFGVGVVWSAAKGWVQGEPEAERERAAFSVVGPYLEVDYYPLRYNISNDLWLRAGVRTSVDWLFQRNAPEHMGVGGFLGGQLELVESVEGLFADVDRNSAVVGYARGGIGIGLFGGAQIIKFQDAQVANVIGGLSFRIPFMAGVACCIGLGDSSSTNSQPSQQRKSYVIAKPKRKAPTP
jgi:hypothetical protein